MKTLCIVTLGLVALLAEAHAGVLDFLGFGKKSTNQPTVLTSSLSQEQVILGLKEALGKGVQNAVNQLGHQNGFLTNLNVKIPMPEKLRTVEKTLRTLKPDKLADDFVSTMNHAADEAVPEAAKVFGAAIKDMSIQDATTILAGTNNAATQYFRRTTETNLYLKFLPIVKQWLRRRKSVFVRIRSREPVICSKRSLGQ